MTTVAYHREHGLASDTLMTGDFKSYFKKLHRCTGGLLVGFSGDPVAAMKFVDWINDGKPEDAKPVFAESDNEGDGFHAIVLYPDGKAEWWSEGMRGLPIAEVFYAIGTGAQGALVAMHLGKTPAQALRVVMKVDPDTGMGVETLTHSTSARPRRGR